MPPANGISAEDLYDLADRVAAMIREVADGPARVGGRQTEAKPRLLDGRRLLNTKEVAAYTSFSLNTIYRAVASGALTTVTKRNLTGKRGRQPGARLLRFRLRDVDAWLAGAGPQAKQSIVD